MTHAVNENESEEPSSNLARDMYHCKRARHTQIPATTKRDRGEMVTVARGLLCS